MTTPGDRIRAFCDQQGLTQAERDYLLGVLGEAVLAERAACARVVEGYDPDEVWMSGEDGSYSERESAESALPKIAAAIRARGGS